MWRTSCSLGPLLMAVCGSLLCSAPAAADPVYDDGSAESVVNDLKAQGYNVVIKLVDRLQHQVAFGLPGIEYKQPWPVGPTPGHLHHGLRRRVLPQPRLRLSGDRPGSLRGREQAKCPVHQRLPRPQRDVSPAHPEPRPHAVANEKQIVAALRAGAETAPWSR